MSIIIWIVLGLVAGFIANALTGRTAALIPTVALGVLGALVGGYLSTYLGGAVDGLNLVSVALSVVGAIVVLVLTQLVVAVAKAL